MSRFWVELSGENAALARAEARAASEALGGREAPAEAPPAPPGVVTVELADADLALRLAGRVALAHRVLRPSPELTLPEAKAWAAGLGADGRSARWRPFGSAGAPIARTPLEELALAYRRGGGRIDLRRPERTVYCWPTAADGWVLGEEVAAVDRKSYERRRMPRLAYQRPVSLPPRRARVAMNLAHVRPGDRVVDPFVGTGALLAEAGLLGARISGLDRDAIMVRGALRNLSTLGLGAERLWVADASDAFEPPGGGAWDAVVTDPPYGRASSAGPEPPAALLARTLPSWAERLRPGGWLVVIVPAGAPEVELPGEWGPWEVYPDRVHRSLTREFRVRRRN